ncbi:hypothetical protein [Streptomyces sp. NPDC096142]|uniref:hypothetical protein n=1 Tax=Streptomyces sp. NPDC096142 TaxID=3366077 RepID=UPI0037FF670D
MPGPPCGTNPHFQMTPGDRAAVEEARAYLATRAQEKKRMPETTVSYYIQSRPAPSQPWQRAAGVQFSWASKPQALGKLAARREMQPNWEHRLMVRTTTVTEKPLDDPERLDLEGITRYRKRPVEVDTIQWTGDNEAAVQDFVGGPSLFYALSPEDREGCDDPEATATVFDKLHCTWVLVYTGQHIVCGVKGEHYPIAEDVLGETYEHVDGPS